MISILMTALLSAAPLQDGRPPQDRPEPGPAGSAEQNPAASPEALRGRVHELRMNLLLGGDQVRRAESEAVEFYSGKLESVEQRLDVIESDLRAKRSSYDLKLDQALSARDARRRDAVMREATSLRGEIAGLEREASALVERREALSRLVGSVRARDRERESLVAQLETTSALDTAFGLPHTGIGLGPPPMAAEASASAFEEDGLMQDLMSRDERAARRLMFDTDPERYWARFPLRPPADALRAALDFPLPDLPGTR